MEKKMRKTVISLVLALSALTSARAQEIYYALPSTTLTVNVEVRQENFFAGPYARFAYKLLNMDVREEDSVSSTVTRVEVVPSVEADPKAWFSCDAENATLLSLGTQGLVAFRDKGEAARKQWRFLPPLQADYSRRGITTPEKEETRIAYKIIQTDTAEVNIPVEHKVLVEKTLEDKAADAADMILSVRKDRLNIVSGNTDASYSGEAMGAALKELDRIEEEYMSLFRGYTVVRTYSASFDVRPEADAPVQRYQVFRLTDDGPVSDGVKGEPFYIELEPELPSLPEDADRKKGKTAQIHYRIPAICQLRLTRNGITLLETRVPVYQLGTESSMNAIK